MTMKLHRIIQNVYSETHRWLDARDDTLNYMKIDERKISKRLDRTDMRHIAAQFAVLFPTHYFKCLYAFESTLDPHKLADWIRHNPYLTLIDMGCGAGAASAALISVLLNLVDSGEVQTRTRIVCVGVDMVENVLGVFYKLMTCIRDQLSTDKIILDIYVIDRPAAESVTDLDELLGGRLDVWKQPALSNVFLAQANIVRPLSKLFDDQEARRKKLRKLGIPPHSYVAEGSFGIREARSYRQIFQQIPIDNLHLITVGTDCQKLLQRVQEMGNSIQHVFRFHDSKCLATGTRTVQFMNPKSSYWRKTRKKRGPICEEFGIDVRSVENTGFLGDMHWHEIVEIDNLRLAWARVRLIRTREAISDEIEIRLFERDLEDNLERLRSKLRSYDKRVAMTDDRFSYEFPKKEDGGRPYVLPRLEEDIVSVAVVQVLGRLAFGLQNTSFSNRPHDNFPRSTEHLYRSWFDAYRRFRDEVSIGVSLETNCKVLETDIESYFTSIEQKQLVDTVVRELRTQSSRVKWLLERLFLVDLVDLEGNPCKRGLAQGAAGSGFYANAFLAPLDSDFGVGDVRYYRYMDDICLVIPANDESEDDELQDVQSQLDISLDALGLKRNCEKTKSYNSQDFRDHWNSGYELDEISDRFVRLTNRIWYANGEYRKEAMRNEKWWDFIDQYRKHLRSIDIYVEADRLSRKLHQYLSKRKRKHDRKNGLVKKLNLPAMNSAEWASQFLNENEEWDKERASVRAELDSTLRSAFDELLRVASEDSANEKRIKELTRDVVFCAYRLPRLGIAGSDDILTKIFRDRPTTIRQPGYILRSLADQGFSEAVLSLMERYADLDFAAAPYYLALVIEAVCHLPVIADATFDWIVSLALDTGQHAIVRLKATETILRSSPGSRNLPTENILAVAKDETSTRLIKNYLLLLAEGGYNVDNCFERSDYLVQSVIQLGNLDGVTDLFKCVEPDIIRKRYYGWEYADDSTEYAVGGYY